MIIQKSFIILNVFISLIMAKKYNNYTLFRSIPMKQNHLDFLNNMSYFYEINIWRGPGLLYRPVEFVISPKDKAAFLADASSIGIYLTTIVEDIQQAFDMQTVKNYIRRNMDSFDWRNYFQLGDIYDWLRDLEKAYPAEVKVMNIGSTYEGRKILAVRLKHKGCRMRSKVIVEGGIHAREWISPAFVTYMINELVRAPESNDTGLADIALLYEWFFVPVVNPDGYEYSHSLDRMWRKNRNNRGVDLNRNFGYGFGSAGVSSYEGSDIYHGPTPFSELETIALRNFITERSSNLEYYLAFHSYGQYMILPYAQFKGHFENYEEVKSMGLEASEKIYRRYNTHYSIGTAYDTVGYTTSGVTGCWVKHTFRVPYVVTLELRDDGVDGFALSPSKILPTCEETMDGVVSLLTPRSKKFTKLSTPPYTDKMGGQDSSRLDAIIIICNVLMFIIVRFDYC